MRTVNMVRSKTAAFCVVMGIAAFSLVCTSPKPRELHRATSPDGTMDIVVATYPAGATVSTPYEVFIVRHGAHTTPDRVVLRTDKSDPPKAAWSSNNRVSISCGGARVWQFRNFDTIGIGEGNFLYVGIKLDCGQNGYFAE